MSAADSSREWLETDGLGGFASGGTTSPAGRFVLVNGLKRFVDTNKDGSWCTRAFVTIDAREAARRIRPPVVQSVSPGEVAIPGVDAGFRRRLPVRDGDGHSLRFLER